ncbi:hypothetical protein [Glycomyces sp. NPDC047010]|uniref:hypothetical protein n=1 Tax=Glycomyces sp. NPDC047010 TaxID=3155023 RepID=UPI0033D893BB
MSRFANEGSRLRAVPVGGPEASGKTDKDRFCHRLGEFRFARTMTFTVFGDDERDPKAARVVLDDGIQDPYPILTIEGLGRLSPSPEVEWRKGWIDARDPWARVIYGNTIGVVRQARSAQDPPPVS